VTVADRVAAVVVDFHADTLAACLDSLESEGVVDVVVVNNGPRGTSASAVGERAVRVVEPGVNLGYGGGVNRGVAAAPARELLIVSNPDVVVHPGAISELVAYLDAHPDTGIVGPTILRPDGTTYPSVRVFPDPFVAMMHAVLGQLRPNNRFTAAYRSPSRDGRVDWVSGAFFVIRRELFEHLGGFDERYFMFAEDMDLCWRAGRVGSRVGACESAIVTHVEGVSRERAPSSMIVAHHVSAMRFEWRTARGWRRALAPVSVALLSARLVAVLAMRTWRVRFRVTK
jgi:N-acetylglucosaminyl-diphospho-decaprenol L-rhamnosyltransferase